MPTKHNKSNNKYRVNARVKMVLRSHLSWLWGYPLGFQNGKLEWRYLYLPMPWDVKTIHIDGLSLSSVIYQRNKLRKDYPKALPRIVGDTEKWSLHLECKLEAIKRLLKNQTVDVFQDVLHPLLSPRDYKKVKTLLKKSPELNELITRFAWWLSNDTNQLMQAIDWLTDNDSAIKNIQNQALKDASSMDDIFLKLFALRQKVGDQACYNLLVLYQQPFWRLARPRISFSKEQLADDEHKNKLLNTSFQAPLNDGDLISLITRWLDKVLALPKRQCRLTMHTFNAFLNEKTIKDYDQYWGLLHQLSLLLRQKEKQKSKKSAYESLLRPIEAIDLEKDELLVQLVSFQLPSFEPSMLVNVITWFSSHPKLLNGLERLLKVINIDKQADLSVWRTPYLYLYFAIGWYRAFHKSDSLLQWVNCLPKVIQFIKANGDNEIQSHRLPLISDVIDNQKSSTFILANSGCYNNHPLFLLKLGEFVAATQRPLTTHHIEYVKSIYDDIDDSRVSWQSILTYINILIDRGINFQWIYEEQWFYLHKLAQENIDVFSQCLERWGNITEQEYDPKMPTWEEREIDLLPLAKQFHDYGFLHIANYFADKKDFYVLDQLAAFFNALNDETPLPKPIIFKVNDAWIVKYPKALHLSLKQLNQCSHDAPLIAHKLLSNDIPSISKIKKEISTLENMLLEEKEQKENLKKRIDKLQLRLEKPIQLSSKKIEKLSSKISHNAYSQFIHHWQKNTEDSFHNIICKTFELETLPEESIGLSKHRSALIALLPLTSETKKAAQKVLSARIKSKPWDLREEPQNIAFLELLKQKNINIKPWLEGIGKKQILISDKEKKNDDLLLFLELEEDPLEIFHMGSHFSTCLSIGNFNFFSVVANAADINKRVLYIRNIDGSIIGRCLFVLNNHGHLLTFTRYSHLKGGVLDQAIDDFANQLCEQMNTIRSDKGSISTLVANEWYNDTPLTFENNIDEFLRNTQLSKQLATFTLNKAHKLIRDLLRESQLVPVVIEAMLEMPIFKERPELSIAFVNIMKKIPQGYESLRLKTAQYLVSCGENRLALQILKNWSLYKIDPYGYRYYGGIILEEMNLFIEISPSFALRILLKSQKITGVNQLEDDQDTVRLKYLANLYRLLHRPSLAERCEKTLTLRA